MMSKGREKRKEGGREMMSKGRGKRREGRKTDLKRARELAWPRNTPDAIETS